MRQLSLSLFICSLALWLFFSGTSPQPPSKKFSTIELNDGYTDRPDTNNECLTSIIYFADFEFISIHHGDQAVPQLGIKAGEGPTTNFLKLYGKRFDSEMAAYEYYQAHQGRMSDYMALTIANTDKFPAYSIRDYCRDLVPNAPELKLNPKN